MKRLIELTKEDAFTLNEMFSLIVEAKQTLETQFGEFKKGILIDEDGHLRTKKGDLLSFFGEYEKYRGWYTPILKNQLSVYYVLEEYLIKCFKGELVETDMDIPFVKHILITDVDVKKDPTFVYNIDKYIDFYTNNENNVELKSIAHNVLNNNRELSERYWYSFGTYNILAQLTRNDKNGSREELLNYTLGLNGECGELTDIIKKWLFHGKQLNIADILYELGDVLFYLTNIAALFGFSLEDVAVNNNYKLLKRYKKGFSEKASNNRIEDRVNNENNKDIK